MMISKEHFFDMRVALVHDYIKEFGGAERVLRTLSDMFPEAPLYTAFRVIDSTADHEFKGKKIIESWLAPLLKIWRLYSKSKRTLKKSCASNKKLTRS